jgi:hypothetical protein
LNDVVCIAEGLIADDGTMRLHVYAGVHELSAAPDEQH